MSHLPDRIAVAIASTGRPVELGRWVEHLKRQTLQPSAAVCVIVKKEDFPFGTPIPDNMRIVVTSPGLPIQRNAALDVLVGSNDIIAFFDDDYVPSTYCLEGISDFFRGNPDIVAANGVLLADGINSPGITFDEAIELITTYDSRPRQTAVIVHQLGGLYGCNMVFRTAAIGQERFDEELPLYAWQEDIDFSARVGRRGRLVKTDAFCGVHQGVKGGRLGGRRLGYSQVANPIYLARKGTLPRLIAAKMIFRNFVKNHAKIAFPEPWIDRAGRSWGNWLALIDVLRGRDHPKNILDLPK